MGGISAVNAQYGFTNPVLAYDDTLKAAPAPTPAAVSPPAATPATAMALATTAQKVDLGNLTLEGQMASALFGLAPTPVDPSAVFFGGTTSPPAANPSSVFFGGGTTTGLPSTSLSAFATSYLAQPAASGSLVNATA